MGFPQFVRPAWKVLWSGRWQWLCEVHLGVLFHCFHLGSKKTVPGMNWHWHLVTLSEYRTLSHVYISCRTIIWKSLSVKLSWFSFLINRSFCFVSVFWLWQLVQKVSSIMYVLHRGAKWPRYCCVPEWRNICISRAFSSVFWHSNHPNLTDFLCYIPAITL